jgi:hypothetical protein
MGMLLIGSSFVLIAPVRERRIAESKFYANQENQRPSHMRLWR